MRFFGVVFAFGLLAGAAYLSPSLRPPVIKSERLAKQLGRHGDPATETDGSSDKGRTITVAPQESREPPARVPVYTPILGPFQQSRLGFEEKGTLADMKVKEGQFVKEGQELCRLDTAEVETTIAVKEKEMAAVKLVAENDALVEKQRDLYQTASSEYDAGRRLASSRAISAQELGRLRLAVNTAQADLLTAQTNRKVAKAQLARVAEELRAAKLSLARHIMKAPFDGQVVRIMRDSHEFIKEGPVVQIAQLDKLRLEASIRDEDLRGAKVKAGLKVEVKSASGKTFPGTLVFVDDVVVAGERRVTVIVENELLGEESSNERWSLHPGTAVEASIVTAR